MSVDDFDTSRFKLSVGPPTPLGGSWSGEGDTTDFVIEARLYRDPVTFTMPGHDPPVAWRAGQMFGVFPMIACPGFTPRGSIGVAEYMEPAPIILDTMPGQRPANERNAR